jgi:hypothetical protein
MYSFLLLSFTLTYFIFHPVLSSLAHVFIKSVCCQSPSTSAFEPVDLFLRWFEHHAILRYHNVTHLISCIHM